MEKLIEVSVKELRSDNGTKFRNHKLEDISDEKDPHEFTEFVDHPALNELDQPESADHLESAETQDNVIIDLISDIQLSPTTIPPSADVIIQTSVPQDRWSRENYIELVNIIGEPLTGITTRTRVRDSDATLSHECLYVNFLSKMELKNLIEALEEG
uniref:Uncharacterized protein n=1 Tax=Tanacetum cinerariifolium TaxID=118510 RepID=A0A699KGN3_TANCI|nr:hypothetical protein [Tanacetum cinerariifolium]